MIAFNGDERFADVVFAGVHFDEMRRDLILRISTDPADSCETIVLRAVAVFDVVHFMRQNVVQYLDVASLTATDFEGFCSLARGEGASAAFSTTPNSGATALGVVFVSANGATIFAICKSVEKCAADGRVIYAVAA